MCLVCYYSIQIFLWVSCMFVYVRVYVVCFACSCIYMYVYVCSCLCACMHVYVCLCLCVCVCEFVSVVYDVIDVAFLWYVVCLLAAVAATVIVFAFYGSVAIAEYCLHCFIDVTMVSLPVCSRKGLPLFVRKWPLFSLLCFNFVFGLELAEEGTFGELCGIAGELWGAGLIGLLG